MVIKFDIVKDKIKANREETLKRLEKEVANQESDHDAAVAFLDDLAVYS